MAPPAPDRARRTGGRAMESVEPRSLRLWKETWLEWYEQDGTLNRVLCPFLQAWCLFPDAPTIWAINGLADPLIDLPQADRIASYFSWWEEVDGPWNP